MKTLRGCFFSLTLAFGFCAVQPAGAASFFTTGSLTTARGHQTATLLPNGKVLVAGGYDGTNILGSAQIYDPSSGKWVATTALNVSRSSHTAILLQNGKVLVVGGDNTTFFLTNAEVYDPATQVWAATGSLNVGRDQQTMTLLQNGKVLVAGGASHAGVTASAELYDPTTGLWTVTGSMTTNRFEHTATLLPNGKVLVAGGYSSGGELSSAELYDPASGTWAATGTMNTAHDTHSATLLPNGKVLLVGDAANSPDVELYDPSLGTWSITGPLANHRYSHAASLLPNGKVLVTGGRSATTGNALAISELYDPATGTWSTDASMNTARAYQTATVLANGQLLIAGGWNGLAYLSSTEQYDTGYNPGTIAFAGAWSATGSLHGTRKDFTLTTLPNGKALAAGGADSSFNYLNTAELFDPATSNWTATGTMTTGRYRATATLLANGKVLVAAGYNGAYISNAETYDPAAGSWTAVGSLANPRVYHTSTLLRNSKVLVAGGQNSGGDLAGAELFDPVSGVWTATSPMSTPRAAASATLLPNGMVLVAGGYNGGYLSSAELYNPATGAWTPAGSMIRPRINHTATLLPNGLVLVAGGENTGGDLAQAETYDPAANAWTGTASMDNKRTQHTAVLLLNGRVLVIGGAGLSLSTEVYDPALAAFYNTGSMATMRSDYPSALLANGKVLIGGGQDVLSFPTNCEIYDIGQGVSPSSQPQITTLTSPLTSGGSLLITGSLLRGISESSGGNSDQNSPSDNPVVQLRSLEGGQTMYLLATNWSTNSYASAPVSGFPFGYALATVFVNGIPGQSRTLLVFDPTQETVTLGNLLQNYDGTAKSVSVTVSPPGPVVNVTYNGSPNAPTNAGNYTVIATIADPTYQGGATNTLVIAPFPASVILGNLLQSYDGNPKNASITISPPGLAYALTYNGVFFTPINAGTYTVAVTIVDPNYQGGATNTLTIINGLTLDTAHTLRTVDPRWYGLNTAIWDSDFDTDSTSNALQELACRTLRFPGGSISDFYHWETGTRDDGYQYDPTRFSNFMHVATNAGVNAYITVNYGTGTTNEASDWVRSANVTNLCGFKYWEVGNECYGSWEADNNTNPPYFAHDPWTYAMRFRDYYTAMKAADPTIRIGIMVTPGEDTYENGNNYVINPRTGVPHFGWTPVVLDTLRTLGITPDFAVHHVYPEYQVDNDALLLQASYNWANDAVNLRQQITDYFPSSGANIELVCTENNADAGSQGRQSTSLVNGLYLADSLGQISKTEFNSFVWWDLRNGVDTGGDFDPSLYGWRTNGDLGIMVGTDTRYPTYYAMKLMQYFAQPGDTILNPATSDSLLSVYAAQKTDGAVSVLVINKDPSNTLTRPIVLAGYTPNSAATIRSFGIPQDEATRTNSPVPGAQDIATNSFPTAGASFNYAFPPYSLTLFTLSPAAPALLVMPPSAQTSNTFVFQLQGQSGIQYVLQTSADLAHWTPTVTNVLVGNVLTVTNPIPPGAPQKFWRVLWQP